MRKDSFLKCFDEGLPPMNVIDIDTQDWLPRPFAMPTAVQRLSLAHACMPVELPDGLDPRYGVSAYLLLGQAGSITDFHVDFSGTSVFYMVLRGRKEFFLVKPTAHNEMVFRQWNEWTDKYSSKLESSRQTPSWSSLRRLAQNPDPRRKDRYEHVTFTACKLNASKRGFVGRLS